MIKIKAERWLLPIKGFIIYDTFRREILFAESEKEVELFFKSAKRNKKEYTVIKVDFRKQVFPDEVIKKCANGILILLYDKAITPNEESEFANFIGGIAEDCYNNLHSLISGVEKLVLTKSEEKFIINTIHRMYGYVGELKNETEIAMEHWYDDITTEMYWLERLLNLSRVMDKVLAIENSDEMREEYHRLRRDD